MHNELEVVEGSLPRRHRGRANILAKTLCGLATTNMI